MKTSKTFLILILILFNLSCTDVEPQIKNEPQSILKSSKQQDVYEKEITNNSLLENVFYQSHLEFELEKIRKQKKEILKAIKLGNKEAEYKLKELVIKEKKTKTNLMATSKISNYLSKVYKIGPVPPCPTVSNGKCREITGLNTIWANKNIKELHVQILDNKGNELASTKERPYFTDSHGMSAFKISGIGAYPKMADFKITRITTSNKKISYILKVNL